MGFQTIATPAMTLSRQPNNVIQVVVGTYSTSTSSSSSTFADTGLTASITPTSSTSKILVMVTQAGVGKVTNATNTQLKLLRGSTDLALFEASAGATGNTNSNFVASASINYLDSPASTSSVTYKTQFASVANNASARVQDSSSVSSIVLMEIAP